MSFQVGHCHVDISWHWPHVKYNLYILLDVLVCSIAVYFYELCSILTSPQGESKYKQRFLFPKFWLAKVLNFTRPGGMRRVQISVICTRFARYLYSRKQSRIIKVNIYIKDDYHKRRKTYINASWKKGKKDFLHTCTALVKERSIVKTSPHGLLTCLPHVLSRLSKGTSLLTVTSPCKNQAGWPYTQLCTGQPTQENHSSKLSLHSLNVISSLQVK